ncbi:acyltransferase [Paenibacillus cremeus]|uniref:Acyltransferase n=1 Tax=Paenibacillus cremeus TaxID=2163881 RepID=A0A559KGT1_9BACL|nr:acyltransferase [Paenibacillus cremeus]TVY11339.1 acyltransferase [Paenibacillus cremeus]
MSYPSLREIEVSRGVAILGVLMIHVTAQALMDTPIESRTYAIYAALNRGGHFSVPTFIFLSGLVLFYRYFEEWQNDQIFAFYRKRLKYVFIPYVFWSTFYFFFNHAFEPNGNGSLRAYLMDLLTGRAEYHLYYIILIIQYYLLLPVLFALLKRVNLHYSLLIIGSVAIQALIGLLNHQYHWIENESIVFTTYLEAFVVGCIAGKNYQAVSTWIRTYSPWLLSSALLFMLLHLIIAELELAGHPIHAAIKEIVVHLYSILAALAAIYIGALTWPKSSTLLSAYGKCSLGIYFMHPALLFLAKQYMQFPYSSALYHPSIGIRLLIILTVPLGLVIACKRVKWAWLIFGK